MASESTRVPSELERVAHPLHEAPSEWPVNVRPMSTYSLGTLNLAADIKQIGSSKRSHTRSTFRFARDEFSWRSVLSRQTMQAGAKIDVR